MKFNPRAIRLLPALASATVLIAASTLTRIALALRPEVAALDAIDLLRAFALGLAFDLAACLYALAPLVLWLALAPDRLARTWIYRAASIAWFGIAAPKGLPRDIQMKLHGELLKILKTSEMQKSMRVVGQEVASQDRPEQFYDFMKAEAAKWAKVVQDSGARVE